MLLRYGFRTADYSSDFLGKMVDVFGVLEQFVVLGMGEQFGTSVLLSLEDETTADLMDVEAVIDDVRQFDFESIVVDWLCRR